MAPARAVCKNEPRLQMWPLTEAEAAEAADAAESSRRFKHQLRLRHHRTQLAGFVGDRRLPHHGRAATVQRHAGACDRGAFARTGYEFGAGIGGGGALACGQIHHRAHRTQRVGKRHVRTAMQNAAAGAQVCSHHHCGDDTVWREFGDLNAHESGKHRFQQFLNGGEVVHGGLSLRC